jgi:hypothetical protein
LFSNDSRKVVIPCFSSLSRSLDVMTAKRLSDPGFSAGVFFRPDIEQGPMAAAFAHICAGVSRVMRAQGRASRAV